MAWRDRGHPALCTQEDSRPSHEEKDWRNWVIRADSEACGSHVGIPNARPLGREAGGRGFLKALDMLRRAETRACAVKLAGPAGPARSRAAPAGETAGSAGSGTAAFFWACARPLPAAPLGIGQPGSRALIGRGFPTPVRTLRRKAGLVVPPTRAAAARSARRCVPTMAAPMPPTASWAPAGVPRGCHRLLHHRLRFPGVGLGAASPLPSSPLR